MLKDKLLIATNNNGKVKEIAQHLQLPNTTVLSYSDWSQRTGQVNIPDPLETGETYYDNALIKAKAAYEWSGIPVLADDSGIEAEGLGWLPGVCSARFAGEGASDQENLEKLLAELKDSQQDRARYVAQLIFFDGKNLKDFRGELPGKIIKVPQGEGGFGYDPIFVPDGHTETLASLKSSGIPIKTHRIRALDLFKDFALV